MTKEQLISDIEAGRVRLSHSSFQAFTQSPLNFVEYKTAKKDPTRPMLFGSFSHAIVFEPETLDLTYAVAPECDRRTTVGKKTWSDFCAANEGKTIITAPEHATAKTIQNALLNNRASRWVLDQITQSEKRVQWQYGGFDWGGIIDGSGEGIRMDLKVLADASPRKVERAIRYDGYARQQVHYGRGENKDAATFIVAADHKGNVSVHEIGRGVLKQAAKEIDYYLSRFEDCILMGDWDKSYDFYTNNENGIYKIEN